jgi:xanthine/CO dehydrogenase XdhC/CoxF family maturation factor
MKEINNIIKSYDEARKEGRQTALATVVHLEGSSYRRPGARMLITDEGQLTGAISGGCLEGDALQKALLVMSQQQSRIVTYDTTDEDDNTLGVGLGCNGIIQVLMEPENENDPMNPVSFLRKVTGRRQKAVLVTVFSLEDKKNQQAGTCLLLDESGNFLGNLQDAVLEKRLKEDAQIAFEQERSSFKNYISEKHNLTAFIEFVKPAVSLVIIGAGNDVIPLVEMADVIGWESSVVDGRSSHARPERFLKACQVLVSKPENVLDQIHIDEQTVFVLMTHNYNYDKAMLKALVTKKIKYLGMLGPKKKLDRMLGELKDEGFNLTAEQGSIVFGPVGLDLGAETAEEIALSIIAEIKAVLSEKSGQSLRNINDVIHSRADTVIEERRLN